MHVSEGFRLLGASSREWHASIKKPPFAGRQQHNAQNAKVPSPDWQNAREILDRLKYALSVDTDKDLAQIIGIDSSTLSTWKSRNTLNHVRIIAICKEEQLSLEWVFFGFGDELYAPAEASRRVAEPAGPVALPKDVADDPDLVRVPIFEGPLGAGSPGEPNEGIIGYGSFFRRWLRDQANIQPELAFIAPVYGSSMIRLFFDGDLVLGERTEGLGADDTYALVWEGELYIKHVRHSRKGVHLISENASFPPIEIPPDEYEQLRILGRVVKKVTGLY